MSDSILRTQTKWENLFFYKKTVVLYQLTVVFCKRFLPKYGDRTVDQMVQAARSGKQNIVEGLADGVTSTEMTIKLLNVARASLAELREDYLDYLRAHALSPWAAKHPLPITVVDDGTDSNETRLGAVRDIQFAIDALALDDDLLIIAGDNVLDFSLVRFINYTQEKNTS